MIEVIGWTIVHSVWQGGVIAALTAGLLYALRRTRAQTRYLVCVACLVVMAGAPVLTARMALRTGTAAPASVGPLPTASAPESGRAPAGAAMTGSRSRNDIAHATPSEPAPGAVALRARIEGLLPWIVGLWLLGVVLFSARNITGFIWARKLVSQGTAPVSDHIRGAAARIADGMRVRVAVRVLASARITVPMLVGWLRPVILLPASVFTGLMPQQIEAILAHELAHVRRNDYLVNLMQTVVETLCFYHPAVWWLSARIREERENACDELAVAACGGDRVFYSRVLLTVEESRGELPALAVAASGGSLARRIHRLLGAQQAHLDIGPRWYAGVFTIALALITAGGALDERPGAPRSSWTGMNADTGKARPDTVIRYAGSASLEQRWQWASGQSKNGKYDRYWVGYLIDGDATGQTWIHFDRAAPVSVGGSLMMGQMRIRGDFNDVRVAGIPLRDVIGEHEPYQVVVLIGYDRERIARVHVASFVFSMNFAQAPLLWLGRASDGESIQRLVALDAEIRDPSLRADLVAAVGMHNSAEAAVPVLERWTRDRSRPSDVRIEAVEALTHFTAPQVLAVLATMARADPDEHVRREAVEAIGELAQPGALDTLQSLARTLRSFDLQMEAIESIGDSPDRRGSDVLREFISDRTLDSRLRREAVESLADRSDGDVLNDLKGYIERSDDPDVQAQAVEALADVHNVSEAERVEALNHLVNNHPNSEIRVHAVEALGDLHDYAQSERSLADIARKHPESGIRRAAVETYMDNARPEDAVALARSIIASDASIEVRLEAVEALGSLDGGAGISTLIEIARETNDPELRRHAIEALLDSEDPRAIAALRNVR